LPGMAIADNLDNVVGDNPGKGEDGLIVKSRLRSTYPLETKVAGLDEVLQFLRLIWAIDHGLNRASKRLERELGITGPQRLVLRFVGRLPGITPGRLANILCLHPSTLTVILRSLERRSLVDRRRSPSDGRSSLLTLTSAGLSVQQPFAGTVESLVAECLTRFDPVTIERTRCVLSDLARALYDPSTVFSGQAANREPESEAKRRNPRNARPRPKGRRKPTRSGS